MSLSQDRLDRYRRIAASKRPLPGKHGLRPHTVAIITRYSFGQHTGDIDMSSLIPLTEQDGQPPKVRWLNGEQLALSGLAKGAIDIGPITPEFNGGGTAISAFDGTPLDTGDVLHLLITGPTHPNGALYKVVDITSDRALHYTLRATPGSESTE